LFNNYTNISCNFILLLLLLLVILLFVTSLSKLSGIEGNPAEMFHNFSQGANAGVRKEGTVALEEIGKKDSSSAVAIPAVGLLYH
jgi:hypothetical protein